MKYLPFIILFFLGCSNADEPKEKTTYFVTYKVYGLNTNRANIIFCDPNSVLNNYNNAELPWEYSFYTNDEQELCSVSAVCLSKEGALVAQIWLDNIKVQESRGIGYGAQIICATLLNNIIPKKTNNY